VVENYRETARSVIEESNQIHDEALRAIKKLVGRIAVACRLQARHQPFEAMRICRR
jgi:hypothetical protein